MKICMLAPEFLPAWGGVGTYIIELVKHLPKTVEVHVVAPVRGSFGNKKTLISDDNLSQYFGSNVSIHIVCKANDTFFYNARFQYACLRNVPRLVKEENIDLVHSHTAHMPDLLLMFRKLRKPVITTIHTTIKSQRLGTKVSGKNLYDWESSEKATYVLYPALRLAEEVYFKRERFYITQSNWMKRWLENNFHINGSIEVIPNSIDTNDLQLKKCDAALERLVPEKLRDKKIILFAGRLLALKGVGTLIEAIPMILRKLGKKDFVFVFAGPGNPNPYLQRLHEMGAEFCCLFTGPIPREKVIQLMMTAELTVVPSFIENSPYTILESMASGTPVIASNVGGIPEIVSDKYDGLLVEPGSSGALANAIIHLLENRSIRDLMGRRAKETIIRRFSWGVNSNRYLKAYSQVLVA